MENSGLFVVNAELLNIIEAEPQLSKTQEKQVLDDTRKLSIRYFKNLCIQAAHKSVSTIVQGVQYLMYCLLERIYEKQQRNHTHLREKLAKELGAFLQFLQKHSKSYFNIDTAMPRYLWQPIHEALEVYYNGSSKMVLNPVEKELVVIILQVYQQTTTEPSPTYRQAAYWQQLTEVLYLNTRQADNDHTKAVYTLLRYNFNHSAFVQYVFHCYTQGADLAENRKEHWVLVLQHINRIIPETGYRLMQEEKECKKSLLKLIVNEMNAGEFSKEAETVMQRVIPFHYNLSVAQLAVALRMQIESGMIETKNVSELLRYFAEQAVTRKASSISIKNLYNNYHQPERAAVNILLDYNTRMRQILIGLLNG